MKIWDSQCEGKEKDTNSNSGKVRILTFFDLITVGVGSSLGVGISVLIGELIRTQTGPAIVVSIIVAGITALLGGLCFAEFGTRFLKVDSVYEYSYFWCKESPAFIFGWALVLEFITGTASVVKGVVTFIDALTEGEISHFLENTTSTNFGDVFPYFDFISTIIVIIDIVISIAIFKSKDSLRTKKFCTICNLVLIISVIIAGICKADIKNWSNEEETSKISFSPFGALGVTKGAAIAYYGFIGFDTISVAGPEIKKRKRNLPLAILATILLTLVSYAGVGVILTLMVNYDKLSSHAAVPFAFQEIGWTVFKWAVALASFFGFETSLSGVLNQFPKIIGGMANDGLLFHYLGDSNSKFNVPVKATVIGGVVAAFAVGFFSFQKLVNLTVIAALFVHLVTAICIILFRYSQKLYDEKTECSKNFKNNAGATVKAMVRNYFNFKKHNPTVVTQNIVFANVILFCISSIGLSVIYNIFYVSLVSWRFEVLIPAGILLSLMFFTLLSMACQPKSQDILSFKVPLLPFLPFLSIFLNIFLMVSLESLTWILFASWMAIGILPHFIWRFLKYLKGTEDGNSLYEINRINSVKLNESIWKIKSDKKSFYEGTINFGFRDDFEDETKKVKINGDSESKKSEKILQKNETEIITSLESKEETEKRHLDENTKLNFIPLYSAEVVNAYPNEEEKVYWECVAEIHTEEEFTGESVALEIVDNTYNFLTEVAEELSKDLTVHENNFETSENTENNDESFSLNLEKGDKQIDLKYQETNNQENKLQDINENSKDIKLNLRNSDSSESLNSASEEYTNENPNTEDLNTVLPNNSKCSYAEEINQDEDFVNLIVKTIYETHNNGMILNLNDTQASDEQNKKKEFKEKLNQLLKNQINNNATVTKNSMLSKSMPSEAFEAETEKEKNKDELYKTIKTLNKSQIRGKLEFLLAKGPPKRLSLESSFNLKIKEAVKENNPEKVEETALKEINENVNDSEIKKNIEKLPPTLSDSIKEKILSLKKS